MGFNCDYKAVCEYYFTLSFFLFDILFGMGYEFAELGLQTPYRDRRDHLGQRNHTRIYTPSGFYVTIL